MTEVVKDLELGTYVLAKIAEALENLHFIDITDDKGTASADTMNKLFIEVGQSKVDIYYTEKNGNTYSWHQLESDIFDDLVIDSQLSNSSTNTVQNRVITNALDNKVSSISIDDDLNMVINYE